MTLKEVNEQVGDNIFVHIYGLTAFPIFLDKIGDLWTGVVLPDTLPNKELEYCVGYLKYEKENKPHYILWFFNNNSNMEPVETEYVVKKVKEVMKDID